MGVSGYRGSLGDQKQKPHTEEDDKPFIEITKLVDKVIVTNEYMARKLNEITKSNNYVVIPNTVPRYLFFCPEETTYRQG